MQNNLSTQGTIESLPIYLQDDEVVGIVTGGKPGGLLLNDEVEQRREQRYIGIDTVKEANGVGGQTWVIIHGWNSSPGDKEQPNNITGLIEAVKQKAGKNDRVLAIDWREAAENGNLTGIADSLDFVTGGNGIAATWIAPVAEFVVKALEENYGINSQNAAASLNLIGHSLGSLASAEIGRIYKTGKNRKGNNITQGNNQGVRTITALDPAAQINILPDEFGGGYDVDNELQGRQNPENFSDTAKFSRAFIGKKSLAGNPKFAEAAHEAIEMDFGTFLVDFGEEHTRVVQSFTNLLSESGKIGELLNLNAYSSIDKLPIEDFGNQAVIRRLVKRTYQGTLNVDNNNQPTLFVGLSSPEKNEATNLDRIIIGGTEDNNIDAGDKSLSIKEGVSNDLMLGGKGNDFIYGKLGSDIITGAEGDDILIGGIGKDILYGGTDRDLLTGNQGADTFVFKNGDGDSNFNNTNRILDFQIGADKIGLIGLEFEDLIFEGDSVDSTIRIGTDGEFIALLKGVGQTEIQNQDLFVPIDESIFQVN